MAAPSITLGIGQVLITNTSSSLGILPIDKNLKFGTVELVYDSCDNLTVGDFIMYDQRNGQQFMYGSTLYILINEQYLSGKEPAAP